MGFYTEAPEMTRYQDDKPTLLVSWWVTIFCTAIICTRLSGRYIRVEKLLREDKIVATALIPLLIRAVCVHFILKYGTNNINLETLEIPLTEDQIAKRVIGSRLVMASRVFYASYLWIIKFTTMDFFGRLAGATRKKSHAYMILGMRIALVATFVAVVIADLVECQPFPHYWQVIPDPGGKCRQGFAQMLVMGCCNILTDLLLIAFPIPIIVSSQIPRKRKILLVLLFSLALLTVGITLYRMPKIIEQGGTQVVRTMWASVEILASTGVGNTVALGSFLRDSGVKKKKFNNTSSEGYSNSRSQSQGTKVQRTLASAHWDDETSDDEHKLKTTNGIWDGTHAPLHNTSDSICKSDDPRRSSKSSGSRPISPTQSHDSLITREQFQASIEMNAPPSAHTANTGPRGLHRATSTTRI